MLKCKIQIKPGKCEWTCRLVLRSQILCGRLRPRAFKSRSRIRLRLRNTATGIFRFYITTISRKILSEINKIAECVLCLLNEPNSQAIGINAVTVTFVNNLLVGNFLLFSLRYRYYATAAFNTDSSEYTLMLFFENRMFS